MYREEPGHKARVARVVEWEAYQAGLTCGNGRRGWVRSRLSCHVHGRWEAEGSPGVDVGRGGWVIASGVF